MTISLWESLARRTENMAESALSEISSLSDWNKARPSRLKEFKTALGIGNAPGKCGLGIKDYGTFKGAGYSAMKIGYQVLPDCWCSGIFFYPDQMPEKSLPGVLYVCGHASNGSLHYQPHGIMWARRGYICLVIDTIEQADNKGEHHGYYLNRENEWLSLGYSAAGGETWNAVRGLDILEQDPNVDSARLGVTGVSGGGAVSFYLAAVDDRIKAVSSLCGLSTPVDAVRNRHLTGHCDCIYPLNQFRRDISEYAALIAPRAAQFCFADHDPLFHQSETSAFVERTKKVFKLYGKAELCVRVTSPGQHGDHPAFDRATAEFFDKYVAGEKHPEVTRGKIEISETESSIFNGISPERDLMDLLPRLISVKRSLPLPQSIDEWESIRKAAIKSLPFPLSDLTRPEIKLDGDWRWGDVDAGTFVQVHHGKNDDMDIWLNTVCPPCAGDSIVIGIANAGENSMQAASFAAVSIDKGKAAYGGFEGRAAGCNMPIDTVEAYPPGSRLMSSRKLLMRAMVLTGQTPVTIIYHDLELLIDYLSSFELTRDKKIYLYGRRDGAAGALYRGIVDDRIAGVFLEELPNSHTVGAPVQGILQSFDIPQAVGLMAPRKVALIRPGHSFWSWPLRVFKRLGCEDNFIIVDDPRHAMTKLL